MLDGAPAAQQCTSAGSLGFCGSVGRGGGASHQESWKREQVLYFLLWYGLLQFGRLLEGWNVSCKVWSFQRDGINVVTFCVSFITCVM